MLSDRCPVSPLSLSNLVYCGETVGWIKMPLGTEIGLGPGHVLDGDPDPPRRGAPPIFGSCHVAKRSPTPISATAELLYNKRSPNTDRLHGPSTARIAQFENGTTALQFQNRPTGNVMLETRRELPSGLRRG